MSSRELLDWVDDVSPNIKNELTQRYDELSRLEKEQVQMGTSVPQLYGSLSRFIANPSTVSVETYKRMLDTDETIGAGIDFMNLSMISRFGDYKHPSDEITSFVRQALEGMEGSWHQNLDEMFSAEWAGFSATEKVWDYLHDFNGMPAFVPKKLVTYPPLTIVFSVDRHGELMHDGIYQYQRYHNTFLNAQSGLRTGGLDGFRPDLYASIGDFPYPIRISADLSFLTVKIPRHKIIHLRSSSTGKFNNPYGRSILRRAYKNWVLKDAFLRMWLVGADRKGTPLVVGYAAPNDTVLSQTDSPGNVGASSKMRSDQAMAEAFRNVHNSSFLVLPGRKGEIYDVEAIQAQGDMNVFKDGAEYFNRALMRAMLLPPLVLGGGDGAGSFALGVEHRRIFDVSVDGKNKVYKQGVLDQFIRPLIMYNFPEAAYKRDGFGEFTQEESDPEVIGKLAEIFRTLTDAGYMTSSAQADMDFVRQKVGAPKGAAHLAPSASDPFSVDGLGDPGTTGDPGDALAIRSDDNSTGGKEKQNSPHRQPGNTDPKTGKPVATVDKEEDAKDGDGSQHDPSSGQFA